MALQDLREFISVLEKRNQLKRIRAEVDAELDIAEITDRVSKQGGPALLFENVRGHSIPVLINALGSRERMMLALGVTDYGEITERITELYDVKTTGMHWQIHKHGAQHFRNLKRGGGGRLDVGVAIGADPVTVFSAIMPLPEDLDEMMIAGFLREKPVEMVKCETVDVEVPANAEIVLEGYVDSEELRTEGPFGDHTGYYSLEDEFPVFHVTCITHRKKPIYQTIIVGKPPQEDCWMGEAIERIYLPLMQRQFPEVADYHMPFAGVFHNLMIASIRKDYPGHARKVMNGIWSLPQAMLTKCIVVIDDDTNVRDLNEVAWRVLNNIDPERDIQFMLGPVDQLDHSSRLPNFGSLMGIDGTRKWKSEAS